MSDDGVSADVWSAQDAPLASELSDLGVDEEVAAHGAARPLRHHALHRAAALVYHQCRRL